MCTNPKADFFGMGVAMAMPLIRQLLMLLPPPTPWLFPATPCARAWVPLCEGKS